MDFEAGARCFTQAALETFRKYGAQVGEPQLLGGFQVGENESVVLLGLVGGWRGAVAFRFDPRAESSASEAAAGEPIVDEDLRLEALLEVVNVVGGRGAAALAGKGRAVWLTPPLMARGSKLGLRLMNLEGYSFSFPLGRGSGGLLFSAAPVEGA